MSEAIDRAIRDAHRLVDQGIDSLSGVDELSDAEQVLDRELSFCRSVLWTARRKRGMGCLSDRAQPVRGYEPVEKPGDAGGGLHANVRRAAWMVCQILDGVVVDRDRDLSRSETDLRAMGEVIRDLAAVQGTLIEAVDLLDEVPDRDVTRPLDHFMG